MNFKTFLVISSCPCGFVAEVIFSVISCVSVVKNLKVERYVTATINGTNKKSLQTTYTFHKKHRQQ